jgi:hypothetical protein
LKMYFKISVPSTPRSFKWLFPSGFVIRIWYAPPAPLKYNNNVNNNNNNNNEVRWQASPLQQAHRIGLPFWPLCKHNVSEKCCGFITQVRVSALFRVQILTACSVLTVWGYVRTEV